MNSEEKFGAQLPVPLAWALWEYLQSSDAPEYWTIKPLSELSLLLNDWIRTEAPIGPTPGPDDRCSSCERWSGHPHADWCSTNA